MNKESSKLIRYVVGAVGAVALAYFNCYFLAFILILCAFNDV